MRILGGKERGRKIIIPKGRATRPTLQIVRKSIFDSLAEEVNGAHILDLFAGAGSLGLEALSRGSQEVMFVEEDAKVIDRLKQNVDLLGFSERANLVTGDAVKTLHRLCSDGVKYDIVFADPPYEGTPISRMLKAFETCDVVKRGGFLVIEHSKNILLPEKIMRGVTLWKMKEFGETRVSFYRKQKELP